MSLLTLKVPKKLLFINETAYTDEWLKNTYSYFHLFDKSVSWAAPRQGQLGSDDLANWKAKAISLSYNIKNKGIIAGRKEMVRIVNEEYGLTVPGRNNFDDKCKDVDDIFCIIGNKQWFYEDVNYSRNIIYHLLYLCSRNGYNSWLINAEKEWLQEYGIRYENQELNEKKKSNVKGFVYSIMNSTFSNTTQKAFRKKLLFLYQEFITVRNKKKFTGTNKFEFTPHVFQNTYKGYIVTPIKIEQTTKTLPDIFRTGNSWVEDCKSHKMNLSKIQSLVTQFYNKKLLVRLDEQDKIDNYVEDDHLMDWEVVRHMNNEIHLGK